MRDLPYGHDVLFENLLDPAHVPWAHHGVQGDRYKAPVGSMGKAQPLDGFHGFHIPYTQDITSAKPTGTKMQSLSESSDVDLIFQAPNMVR